MVLIRTYRIYSISAPKGCQAGLREVRDGVRNWTPNRAWAADWFAQSARCCVPINLPG